MKLITTYEGSTDPFEGDHTVWLRSLPFGARATKATVKVTPIAAAGGALFVEVIDNFDGSGSGGLNTTKVTSTGFVEVDFHARRTLASVTGSSLTGLNLQVDVGGTFIDVNKRGALGGSGSVDDLFKLSGDTSSLPGLAVNKFRLTKDNVTPDVTEVTVRSVPTNLTIKLGQTPAFWVRVGELAAAAISPSFAETLNAFLLTAPSENGYYQIPFVVHSDTLARLDVELNIDYVIEKAVLPSHLPEITLPYNFSTLPGADEKLTTVALPRQAAPVTGKSTAQVRGEFQPTRVRKGDIGEEPKIFPVRVAPDCSLAQAFQSEGEIALTGIDLPLANTEPGLAGMSIAIQADDDGKPSGEVLIRADVRVEKPLPGQTSWGSATLPSPFRVLPKVRYWLVLQSLIGEAYWNATAGTSENPTLQCSRDSGLSWRAATAPNAPTILAALLRLRDKPDRFSIPVQLQIGKGPSAVRRRLDEYAPLGRIEFNFDFAEKLGEHLSTPELASPCGSGELLTNGSFDDPPHDDATERLFGRENVDGRSQGNVDLSGGIDLSVERFVSVSVSTYIGGGYDTQLFRIDCAGNDPAHTTLKEIIANARRAAGQSIFDDVSDKYLGIASGAQVEILPWCKAEVPTGWQGEAGHVIRAKEMGRVFAVLVAPPNRLEDRLACSEGENSTLDPLAPAELAQNFPVAGNCQYLLRFLYGYYDFARASGERLFTTSARWQIEWLDGVGQTLGTDGAALTVPPDDSETSPLYETRIKAPERAVKAELRFIQPAPGNLALEDVSLVPALETLNNTFFQFWETSADSGREVPRGWTLKSGRVEPDLQGARLFGDGPGSEVLPDDSVLKQIAEVSPGQTYTLQVHSLSEGLPPVMDSTERQAQQRARLELHWIGDGPIGAPILLPLDGRDFPVHAWRGAAPEGAKQAEIRLIQPRGQGRLLVVSVSFMQADLVDVPLIFLSETPGELNLSNLRVTYNLPQPPEEESGDQPTSGNLAARVRMAVVRRAEAVIQPAEAVRVSAMEIGATPRESPLANMPAIMIAGVGKQFSKILAKRKPPITTIADLAALDPDVVIKGLPQERRLELKTAAEMILAIDIDIEPFAALEAEPLEALLTLAHSELANRVGQPVARAEQLQRELRALRLLIKNDNFQNLHLSDLIRGQG